MKPYRGINVWLLLSRPYTSPYWLTYKQANEIGGTVRKGEKGTTVVFWKFSDERTAEEADTHSDRKYVVPFVRTYTIFNTEQCSLPQSLTERLATPEPEPIDQITACENILKNMPQQPAIEHGGDRASYLPALDTVAIPHPSQFISMAEFFSTLYHELVHSTGHPSRLARPEVIDGAKFASHAYYQEEMVAEFGAAFLCGICDIAPQTLENSAAYIAHWVERLQKDKAVVIKAASQAQRAVDFILGKTLLSEVTD